MKVNAIIIYLAKDLERKRNLINNLDSHYFDIHLVEGIDGKNLSEDELIEFKLYSNGFYSRYKRAPLNTEYACLKSHIKAWKYVQDNSLINAIVFEDDAIVNSCSSFNLGLFDINSSVKFFGGFEGLRGASLKIWDKTEYDFIFKCVDFKFLHRMSSYSLDSRSIDNYVNKMISKGIVNDDYYMMFKEGIIDSVYLYKKYEHPPVSAPSHILARKENKSLMIFSLKRIFYNILNFSSYTYEEIPRQ